MYHLSIDQSYTSTGYCIFSEARLITQGIITSDKTQDPYDRADHIASEVTKLVSQYDIEEISLEGLAFGMIGNATRDLAGLQFVLITRLRSISDKISIMIVPPLSIKKLATGSGKASKKEMIASLPTDVATKFKEAGIKATKGLPDVADAYWIGQYAYTSRQAIDPISTST